VRARQERIDQVVVGALCLLNEAIRKVDELAVEAPGATSPLVRPLEQLIRVYKDLADLLDTSP